MTSRLVSLFDLAGRRALVTGGSISIEDAMVLARPSSTLRHLGVRCVTSADLNVLHRDAAAQHAQCGTSDPRVNGAAESGLDAVRAKAICGKALAAIKPGGVVMHIGLQDWGSEIDMLRKLTLAEITLLGTYTYSMADLRATVAALGRGVFGDLSWVERRSLAEAPQAFDDLHHGRLATAKVVLEPSG